MPTPEPARPVGSGLLTAVFGAGALVAAAGALAFGLSATDDFRISDWLGGEEIVAAGASPAIGERPRGMIQPEPVVPTAAPAEPAAEDPPSEPAVEPNPDSRLAHQQAQLDAQRERDERARAQALEAQDLRRKQMIESEWQQRSRRQAREGIVVTMYSTGWCPSCVAARSYMDGQGIAYVDHDIDQDESARAVLHRLNPRGSIPTMDIEGEVLVGFGAARLEGALDKAARKRTGI